MHTYPCTIAMYQLVRTLWPHANERLLFMILQYRQNTSLL
jgi:hypothetical protein